MEQELGIALAVEGAVALYGNERVLVKPLCPDLVSMSVIAWKKHQPMGTATAKFLKHISMSVEHMKV